MEFFFDLGERNMSSLLGSSYDFYALSYNGTGSSKIDAIQNPDV